MASGQSGRSHGSRPPQVIKLRLAHTVALLWVDMVPVGLVLIIPALAAGVAVFQRPQRGVLLLVALAPFDGLLLIVPHPVYVEAWTEILVVLIVACALVRTPAPRNLVRVPSWLWATFGLGLLALARTIPDPSTQALLGLRLAFFFTAIVFVLWRHPLDGADRDRLVSILMATGFIAAAIGIGQQLVGAEALNRLGYEYNSVIRTTNGLLRSFSTFNQPFPFAFHVMVVLLVALPVALSDPTRRRNRLFLLASPLLVIGLATALVRAAMGGLVVGLIVLAVIRFRIVVHALAALTLVALLAWPAVGSAILSSSSVTDRTSGWNESSEQILANPFGAGMGAVGAAAEKAQEDASTRPTFPSSSNDDAYQPDNHYVLVLIELGPLGLWVFVAVIVSGWNHARRIAHSHGGTDRALALGIAAATAGAAAAAVASTYWEIFPVDLYFWTLLGVLTSIESSSASTPSHRQHEPEPSHATPLRRNA